jgi:hypothetical protein
VALEATVRSISADISLGIGHMEPVDKHLHGHMQASPWAGQVISVCR